MELLYISHHNVVKNADNPPELVSVSFCAFSRFFLSMSCSPNFLLFFNSLLGVAGVEAKDD
jgi:hypothetical protein